MAEYKICFSVAGEFGAQIRFEAKPGVSYEDAAASINKENLALKLPAADVAPVVYGRWAHLGGDEWCCSVCGFVITTEGSWVKPAKKYCEDCGAKMDGGAGNAGEEV